MSIYLNTAFHMAAHFAMFFTPFAVSAEDIDHSAGWPTSTAVQSETGQIIPAGAIGTAQIDTPRVATLLKLRGIMGSGTLTIKSNENRDCLTLPVRLVAGDFGGNGISTHVMGPIRLIIQTTRVANALRDGDDVVSDMYRITSQINDRTADIIIQSGLNESHGFVLNPGSSVAADIFGPTASQTACSEL